MKTHGAMIALDFTMGKENPSSPSVGVTAESHDDNSEFSVDAARDSQYQLKFLEKAR